MVNATVLFALSTSGTAFAFAKAYPSLPSRSVIAFVVSLSISREKTSPGLILMSLRSSDSGTSICPASFTSDTVYFSPSVTLTVM